MLGRDPSMSPGFELMRQMFRPFGDLLGQGSTMMAMPRVEVFERGDRIVVRAELPGMTREDVKVRVLDDTLIIEGERRNERGDDGEKDREHRHGMYESEFQYGHFRRQVTLPGRIDANQVRARFQHGVLEVELQCETPRSREVPIEVGEAMAGTGGRTR